MVSGLSSARLATGSDKAVCYFYLGKVKDKTERVHAKDAEVAQRTQFFIVYLLFCGFRLLNGPY